MAIFLQSLCAKLGAVTGLDLAQNCKKNFNPKLNLVLYILTEIAIIATDLAEVIGTAISLNILFNIPLFLGVVLTIIDVLIVLMAYRPNGPMIIVRIFEAFVSVLVLGTVICFAIELVTVSNSITFKEIFDGFLPSRTVIQNDGLYLSLAILGATVMPHSLYLGSGLVQPRLREYDIRNKNYVPDENLDESEADEHYKPSIDAIDETMAYTITELVVSLFTVALFVNSSILIIAAATFNNNETNTIRRDTDIQETADLFTIYHLLSTNLSKTAGVIFALALLFSGLSAGVVCTLAGQMVSEGFLEWTITPSLRRIITRSIAIIPCLVLSLISGRQGLSNILNFSQVVLSFLLPIVSAPLIIFTNNKRIMKVAVMKKSLHHQNSLAIANAANDGNGIQLDDFGSDSGGAHHVSSAVQHHDEELLDNHLTNINNNNNTNNTNSKKNNTNKNPPSYEESTSSTKTPTITTTTTTTSALSLSSPTTQAAKVSTSSMIGNYAIDENDNYNSDYNDSIIDDFDPDANDTNRLLPKNHLNGVDGINDNDNRNYNILENDDEEGNTIVAYKDMSNGTVTKFLSILIWGFITVLNFYLVFSLAMGKDIPL